MLVIGRGRTEEKSLVGIARQNRVGVGVSDGGVSDDELEFESSSQEISLVRIASVSVSNCSSLLLIGGERTEEKSLVSVGDGVGDGVGSCRLRIKTEEKISVFLVHRGNRSSESLVGIAYGGIARLLNALVQQGKK